MRQELRSAGKVLRRSDNVRIIFSGCEFLVDGIEAVNWVEPTACVLELVGYVCEDAMKDESLVL